MSTLKATHTDELLKRDKLLLQYQKTLQKVEAKYAAKEKELAEEERQLVKEIVAKSKGDTNAIRKEVQNLFDGVSEWMHTLSKQGDTVEDLLVTEELEACVSVMKKMRETLGKMDARLDDLSMILEGYDAYIKQNGVEDDPSKRRPAVDTTSSDVVQGAEESYGSDDESGA